MNKDEIITGLFVLILSLLPFKVSAQSTFWGDTISDGSGVATYALKYEVISDSTVKVMDITEDFLKLENVVVPEAVNWNGKSMAVTEIGNNAFSSHYKNTLKIERITMPKTVTTIRENAFKHAYFLYKQGYISTLDGNVTYDVRIKDMEVGDIDAWCRVKLDGVYSHPVNHAHESCHLVGVMLGENLDCSIHCSNGENHNLYLNGELVEDVALPEDLDRVNNYIFMNFAGIKSITSKKPIKYVGDLAFGGCFQLANINLESTLDSIAEYAFEDCRSLRLPSVPVLRINSYVGNGAFLHCKSLGLSELHLNGYVGYYAFAHCKYIPKVVIGKDAVVMQGAFVDTKIDEFYIYCAEPPSSSLFFDFYSTSEVGVVYVPDAYLEAYKASSAWKDWNLQPLSASGVDHVLGEDGDAVEYYNLQGVKVENPANGVFIKKQGGKTAKVVL